MRNKLLSLVFMLTLSIAALAQTSLKGRVIDEATQTPIVEPEHLYNDQRFR